MIEVEIDGQTVQVESGVTIMQAARALGVYIPHFCYHEKLSIAASCRMCLVEVKGTGKALPACATPVTGGMCVKTTSKQAVDAQQDVMQFLLANHPLDCPICDQGGECQLQDIAVGYGSAQSHYKEEKRVVFEKNLGALISTGMTRCIHCSRCVRFGREVAGESELGMINRGEHTEVVSYLGHAVQSELSGNMIDLCPVGALTSKPFRFSARAWELQSHLSISPHDSLGSNLTLQVKGNQIRRVVPFANEAVNECWISDRDRFSYEALYASSRLTSPMIKVGEDWSIVSWQQVFEHIGDKLKALKAKYQKGFLGTALSSNASLEDAFGLKKFVLALDSEAALNAHNRIIDERLDAVQHGVRWFGVSLDKLKNMRHVLFVGASLCQELPVLAGRIRQYARQGLQVSIFHAWHDDLKIERSQVSVVSPSNMVGAIAALVDVALKRLDLRPKESMQPYLAMAQARLLDEALLERLLQDAPQSGIFVGSYILHHPDASVLCCLLSYLAEQIGSHLGFLGEGANEVGLSALEIDTVVKPFQKSLPAYFLLNVEPDYDLGFRQQALDILKQAEFVVSFASFKDEAAAVYADVLLPVSAFAEVTGHVVNLTGYMQSAKAAVTPYGDSRPAWKIFRALADHLELSGWNDIFSEADFGDQISSQLGFASKEASLKLPLAIFEPSEVIDLRLKPEVGKIEKVVQTPAYWGDSLVRNAPALQTMLAASEVGLRMSAQLAQRLGLEAGSFVRVKQGDAGVILSVIIDDRFLDQTVGVYVPHVKTLCLDGSFGFIEVHPA